ncbi:hypothetical protein D3C87_2082160 [compost metagenome]
MARFKNRMIELNNEKDKIELIIPDVYCDEEPKIKIYDSINDGSYFYRKIGFNRKINDDD